MPPAASPDWWDDSAEADVSEPRPARRRARVVETAEPRLSRAHAADFAQAFDIDDAFGAPSPRFSRDTGEGHVIVLERAPARAEDAYEDEAYDERYDERPAARGAVEDVVDVDHELLGEAPERDAETGRRTVRISGRPEATVAPRRLREIEPRRSRRSVAERAAARPDRIALYAVLLGLFLVVLAAASSSAHP